VAMHELDTGMRHAEDRMGDLRERRLQALAMAVRADAQLEAAVGGEAREALLVAGHERDAPRCIDAGAMPGLLRIHREPDADMAAVALAAALPRAHRIEPDRRDRTAQRLRVIARIEMPLGDVVERHLLRPHQAAPAQFRRLED